MYVVEQALDVVRLILRVESLAQLQASRKQLRKPVMLALESEFNIRLGKVCTQRVLNLVGEAVFSSPFLSAGASLLALIL